MAVTLLDDLRDLQDDLANGIRTYAPSVYFENNSELFNQRRSGTFFVGGTAAEEYPWASRNGEFSDSEFIEQLFDSGAIETTLCKTRVYANRGLRRLDTFLEDRDEMEWFMLHMIFRLMRKRFDEFTPDHVRNGNLGIGFSSDEELNKLALRL